MSVLIYKLERGIEVWRWLCPRHLAKAKAAGWHVVDEKPSPHEDLPCDDCREAA